MFIRLDYQLAFFTGCSVGQLHLASPEGGNVSSHGDLVLPVEDITIVPVAVEVIVQPVHVTTVPDVHGPETMNPLT